MGQIVSKAPLFLFLPEGGGGVKKGKVQDHLLACCYEVEGTLNFCYLN